MRRHDLSFEDLEALVDAAAPTDRFHAINVATMRRMTDFDLRRVLAAIRSDSSPAAARLYALAEQELAVRSARANRLTMLIAAASLIATIVGTVVTVIVA